MLPEIGECLILAGAACWTVAGVLEFLRCYNIATIAAEDVRGQFGRDISQKAVLRTTWRLFRHIG